MPLKNIEKRREYHRQYINNRYKTDPKYRKAQIKASGRRNKRYKAELRELIIKHLESNPCVDCGTNDIRVLEFDHVRGDKVLNVMTMVGSCWAKDKVFAEINKCEVRCCNCHRIRTQKVGGHFRYLLSSE